MHAVSFSLSLYSYFVRDDLASSIWFLLFVSLLFCSQYLAFRMLEALVKWCKLKWDVNTYICAYPHVCMCIPFQHTALYANRSTNERQVRSGRFKAFAFSPFRFFEIYWRHLAFAYLPILKKRSVTFAYAFIRIAVFHTLWPLKTVE